MTNTKAHEDSSCLVDHIVKDDIAANAAKDSKKNSGHKASKSQDIALEEKEVSSNKSSESNFEGFKIDSLNRGFLFISLLLARALC